MNDPLTPEDLARGDAWRRAEADAKARKLLLPPPPRRLKRPPPDAELMPVGEPRPRPRPRPPAAAEAEPDEPPQRPETRAFGRTYTGEGEGGKRTLRRPPLPR